jgi:hypothetical protein
LLKLGKFLTRLCKLQKWCTRLAAARDKVYQLLAHGRWFSHSTKASSTTKTSRHDIAEIESGVKHQRSLPVLVKHAIQQKKNFLNFYANCPM